MEHNASFGVHVIGGAAVRARGCDIRFNEQSGVHVVHPHSTCVLDTCRISDNGWYGVFAHKVRGEVPGDVSVAQCLVRRNARGSVRCHAGCHVHVESSWGVFEGSSFSAAQLRAGGNREEAVDAEDDDALVADWLAQMGLGRLGRLFAGVRIERVRDARSLSVTDLQAMGVDDLFLRRLLFLRLARPHDPDPE